jgi:hypothetical protein
MYTHRHIYIYQFEMKNHSTWSGETTCSMQYSLCTNISDPNHKENRSMLEHMLRLVYGHMPKGVKFLQEKRQ